MRIYGTTYESLRPDRSATAPAGTPARPADGASPTEPGAPAVPRGDSVQFSAIGRQLSAAQVAALSPERVQELRDKVMRGAYNSLEVVDQVARRILDSGEL